MLRIGLVGMSAGNGHPFSFSAILNGYEPELMAASPYPTIFEYLRQQPPEAFGIEDARVTHVWAADPVAAELVARTCRIPHVVRDYRDMVGRIDAVILPHDDGATHLEMARPFLECGVPAFVDKPLADTVTDALELVRLAGPSGLLMSCSALRYSAEVRDLGQHMAGIEPIISIHGATWRTWIKYGVHLVEAVYTLLGPGVAAVRNCGEKGAVIVHLEYPGGPHVVFHGMDDAAPLIQLVVYGRNGHRVIGGWDWFTMFKNTLAQFVAMVKSGRRPIRLEETLEIVEVVLAAERSLQRGGARVELAEMSRP